MCEWGMIAKQEFWEVISPNEQSSIVTMELHDIGFPGRYRGNLCATNSVFRRRCQERRKAVSCANEAVDAAMLALFATCVGELPAQQALTVAYPALQVAVKAQKDAPTIAAPATAISLAREILFSADALFACQQSEAVSKVARSSAQKTAIVLPNHQHNAPHERRGPSYSVSSSPSYP